MLSASLRLFSEEMEWLTCVCVWDTVGLEPGTSHMLGKAPFHWAVPPSLTDFKKRVQSILYQNKDMTNVIQQCLLIGKPTQSQVHSLIYSWTCFVRHSLRTFCMTVHKNVGLSPALEFIFQLESLGRVLIGKSQVLKGGMNQHDVFGDCKYSDYSYLMS